LKVLLLKERYQFFGGVGGVTVLSSGLSGKIKKG
jgi:hypothetical protein